MKYDWEQQARDGIMPHLVDLDVELADTPFEIWGVAVVNVESGEGAYWPINKPSGVISADVAKDAMGDAMRAYNEAVRAIFTTPRFAPAT